ncbi:Fc receptor-like protein 5, partial [Micropterus dolomieu]|uniref:Fc receptor-like protein 5 n=1 Tax=Micropterus dolomieu TaxID=147949 RepID=UPI001E8E2440
MDLTALFMRLLMDVLVLFVAQVDCSYFAQKADRQQFFEYETFTVKCEELGGLTEWRVMRKLLKSITTNYSNWNSSAPSCTIDPAFQRHSGEYWCENAKEETSGAVNITVTGGSVILEVPVRPVVEGHDVVLQCRNKKTDSKHIADFYKDGSQLGTRYENKMTIRNFSKSDEGLYKCSISGAGESAESWLAVLKQSKAPYEDNHRVHSGSTDLLSPLWIVVGVLFVALLLLVTGLLLCRKHR